MDRQTDRQVTDIATYRLNQPRGRFIRNIYKLSETIPAPASGESSLVVYYLQLCVGRDEPVVSLGTNSEFIEYIAAVRGQITNCRKDNGINTFTLYSFSIFPT